MCQAHSTTHSAHSSLLISSGTKRTKQMFENVKSQINFTNVHIALIAHAQMILYSYINEEIIGNVRKCNSIKSRKVLVSLTNLISDFNFNFS